MTQYAYFDSTVAAPSPVLGWYDTDQYDYPNLPATADLVAMNATQWAGRMTGSWAVQNGLLVAYTAPVPVVPLLTQAQAAWQAASATCYNSFTMLGAVIPAAWITYNQALQAIIDGTSTATTLPATPT